MDLFGDLPSVKHSKKRSSSADQTSACDLPNENSVSETSVKTDKTSRASKGLSLVGTLGAVGTTRSFLPTALLRKSGAATSNTSVSGGTSGQMAKSTLPNVVVGTEAIESCGDASLTVTSERQSDNGNATNSGKKQEEDQSIEDNGESEELALLHASVTDPYDPFVPNDYLEYCEEKRREVERRELEEATRETLRQQQIIREQIAEERRKMIETGDYQSVVSSVISRHAENTEASGNVPDGSGRGRGVSNLPAWLLQKQQENSNSLIIPGQNADIKDGNEPSNVSAPTTQNPVRLGRGRGVHNLPAWLLKKQEESLASDSVVGSDPPNFMAAYANPQNDSVSTTTTTIGSRRCVVLYNMTPPGAIDEDLHDEVKEECEAQCGPVEGNIIIKDADAQHPQVRVFVLFNHATDAEKASRLFHGRSFGGRQISASLLDEVELSSL
jgi:hypothetical protein